MNIANNVINTYIYIYIYIYVYTLTQSLRKIRMQLKVIFKRSFSSKVSFQRFLSLRPIVIPRLYIYIYIYIENFLITWKKIIILVSVKENFR